MQVRHIGVSNETSWGVTKFCQLAEQLGLPKIVSIQNSYSLLARALHLLPPGHSARRGFCLLLLASPQDYRDSRERSRTPSALAHAGAQRI